MLMPAQWWIAVAPMDLRGGMDRLWVAVQTVFGQTAQAGAAYVFRNRNGTRIKVLVVDDQGVWLCTRRLHEGRFMGPRPGDAFCALSAEQFAWLCAGVDWHRLSGNKVFSQRM